MAGRLKFQTERKHLSRPPRGGQGEKPSCVHNRQLMNHASGCKLPKMNSDEKEKLRGKFTSCQNQRRLLLEGGSIEYSDRASTAG